MQISKKGEYALKALIELAINYEKNLPVTLISDIAKKEEIPLKYLEQILLTLKNAGILTSKRGVGGGYSLAKAPSEISLGDVVRIIEGPLAPLNCVSVKSYVKCPSELTCGIRSVMLDVRNAISNVLDNVSLGEMSKRTIDLIEKNQNVSNYVI